MAIIKKVTKFYSRAGENRQTDYPKVTTYYFLGIPIYISSLTRDESLKE